MGSVVGEKVVRAAETGTGEKDPAHNSGSSGGARMQEGIFPSWQLARVPQL